MSCNCQNMDRVAATPQVVACYSTSAILKLKQLAPTVHRFIRIHAYATVVAGQPVTLRDTYTTNL